MKRDALDYCFGYYDQTYLGFVNRFLLLRDNSDTFDLPDPFALDVPSEKLPLAYVPRKEVEEELQQLGCKLILGASGSGKSTLFDWCKRTSPPSVLTVPISLLEVPVSLIDQEFTEGRSSVFALDMLAKVIFNCFWEQIIVSDINRNIFLPELYRDEGWLHKLRYFYHRLSPYIQEVSSEVTLMVWLRDDPEVNLFSPNISSDNLLRQLLHFIANPPVKNYSGTTLTTWPYRYISVLVDGTATLPTAALLRLLGDAQIIYNMACKGLGFKILVDAGWEEQVRSLECIRRGRLPTYTLPEWQDYELAQLLTNRIYLWRKDMNPELDMDSNALKPWSWVSDLPESCIDGLTKQNLARYLTEGALQSRSIVGAEAAPVHLLRLMRGFVAIMAERIRQPSRKREALTPKVLSLCQEYWDRVTKEGVNL
jgi:energy-coupling factor transporter ATP-binding protein EcfA2